MRLEELFGVSRRITIAIIASSALLSVGMIHLIMKPDAKETFQISHDGMYYLTTDPIRTGDCVVFTDEDGTTHEICGYFKMKKI